MEKIIIKFVGLKAKNYSSSKNEGSQDKKEKGTKKCVIKRKRKFESYKNCLEAIQLDNKIKYLEKKRKSNIDSLRKIYKKFIRNNKSIWKTQQRFKSERHNVWAEEINKTALSSNNDKRMPLIDAIERYAYGTSKELVIEKELIKCNSIIKLYKNS